MAAPRTLDHGTTQGCTGHRPGHVHVCLSAAGKDFGGADRAVQPKLLACLDCTELQIFWLSAQTSLAGTASVAAKLPLPLDRWP